MKVSIGEVLWNRGGRDRERQLAILDAVYFKPDATHIHQDRLVDTFGRAEVFAVVFENVTEATALELHSALTSDECYLGMKEARFEIGPHPVVYRNLLADAAVLTASLLTLNPTAARKPYLAYEKRMVEFFRESTEKHSRSGESR